MAAAVKYDSHAARRACGRQSAARCLRYTNINMAFTFAALSYIVALIVDAFLIFFAIFHVSIVLYVPCRPWASVCPEVTVPRRGAARPGGVL